MGLLCQNQKESTVFCSESSSVQKPARKVKPVCQVKADIVYSIQKNGIKYGCKICLPHKVFANYTLMYQHFSQIHDIFPLVSMCKDCQKVIIACGPDEIERMANAIHNLKHVLSCSCASSRALGGVGIFMGLLCRMGPGEH